MKNRAISETILRKSKSRFGRIQVITGARQTGKSTLVKNIFSDFEYISIEDPVTVNTYKSLTAAQWKELFPFAILDEVQKEPQLVESIKAVYDQFDEPRYILLGSSQILLLKKIKESLAGRCQIVELFPLTLPEMLTNSWTDKVENSFFQKILLKNEPTPMPLVLDKKHVQKLKAFSDYLKFGAYPAISSEGLSDEERNDWLRNYVKTYLERDIRDLAEFRHLEPFTKVQRLLGIYTAQMINYSQLAVEAGVTSKTAQQFMEYLSISYQILVLQPWHRNATKRLVKSPKVHFLDPGVHRAVIQKRGDLTGHEFESAVIAEIYKQVKCTEVDAECYHLRTSDGREVDFLIELEAGYIAIEIKMAETVRAVDGKHLRDLENILDKPVLKRYVLSNDRDIKDLGFGVVAMPVVGFLG